MRCEQDIAVLLATYNGEKYLAAQLDSLFAQTCADFTVFVSDDGSCDGTMALLRAYQERFPRRIVLLEDGQPGYGSAGNFFRLIRAVESRFYMTCDQDDIWHADKVEQTRARMQRLREDVPALVHTDLRVVDETGAVLADSFLRYSGLDGNRVALHYLLAQNVVTGCTMMFNRALRDAALALKTMDGVLMHDWFLALLAAAVGQVDFLPRATMDYRQHGHNAVGAADTHAAGYALRRMRSGNLHQAIENSMRQSARLAEDFADQLPPAALRLTRAYGALMKRAHPVRICFYCRHRVLKCGWRRIVAQMIWG